MKYLTKFTDKNTALEFTTGGRVLKAPQVSKVGNDAIFSESIKRGKSCIFVEEGDGELKLIEFIEGPADNEIWYTTADGNVVTPSATDVFGGANIVNNEYNGGQGVITFDGPVTSIGEGAFDSRYSLTSIIIPNSVTNIGNLAFYGCSLTSIVIPDGVTSIGDRAFQACESLTSVTIPNSVTSIGKMAFGNCYGLSYITYEGTQTQWNTITKGTDWNRYTPAAYVQCSDGQVTL